jgi:hypothetical protein
MIMDNGLGWGDVGWHGGFSKTLRMDGSARERVEWDRHSVQPVWPVTRTPLISGHYPGRFEPHARIPSNLRAMLPGTCTPASALRSMRSFTAMVGDNPRWPEDRNGRHP